MVRIVPHHFAAKTGDGGRFVDGTAVRGLICAPAMTLDQLINGDCIAGMNKIPEGTVDLAFADPPFNIGYKYDVYEDRLKANHYLDWTRKWGQALVRTLKPTGTFWLAIGDDFAAELKLIFQRDLGLCCRSWVIWYYTFGVNCKYKFSRSHTHLFHFVKDPKKSTFNRDDIRVPSARQLVYNDIRANSAGRLPDDTWILRPQDAPESFQSDEDTWYVPRVCGTFKERAGWHGCQMPEQLLGRIIRACSNENETVLDPFGGSGTTLAVAKKLNRRFIGFELSKNYAKKIVSRLQATNIGEALLGPENPLTIAPPTPRKRKPSKQRDTRAAVDPDAAPVGGAEKLVSNRGVIDAFRATHDGYPVDRVIADPKLNAQFLDQCRQLGLPGSAFDWNHRLMNLRKAGHFKGMNTFKVTSFEYDHREFDRYRFACEIAIQHFEQEGKVTLDNLLCDPKLADQFDQYVLAMIPDHLDSLKIRWFALRIRKAANYISRTSANIVTRISKSRQDENPFALDLSRVPAKPGLYWLWAAKTRLYVGETENLAERFQVQFGHRKFGFWGNPLESLQLTFRTVSGDIATSLPKHQSRWISEWRPIGNYERLAARE